MKAEHDKLDKRLANATVEYKKLREERDELENIKCSLETMVNNATALNPRSETTYLNIIGAMLELMLGQSPGGNDVLFLLGSSEKYQKLAQV